MAAGSGNRPSDDDVGIETDSRNLVEKCDFSPAGALCANIVEDQIGCRALEARSDRGGFGGLARRRVVNEIISANAGETRRRLDPDDGTNLAGVDPDLCGGR